MGFTTEEAAALRNNIAKLYKLTRVSVEVAAKVAQANPHVPPADIADQMWRETKLDDLFHELGSQGYRQLIKSGWSPYHDAEEDEEWWRPQGGAVE